MLRYEGVVDDHYRPIFFARTLLPLVQVPPAGFWRERAPPAFVIDPRPLPDPADAAALVLERYLAAFGPASRRDVAAWAGVAQRDFAEAWERLATVTYRDENGAELLDLPDQPLPPASTRLPVRLPGALGPGAARLRRPRADHPARARPLKLTLSGDQTVTVDGRVAASWKLERATRRVKVVVDPHVEIRRSARRRSAPRRSAPRVRRAGGGADRGRRRVGRMAPRGVCSIR